MSLGRIAHSVPASAAAVFRVLEAPGVLPGTLRVLLVCAVPVFVGLYHDLDRHYLWTVDWEWQIIYNASLLNSGLPNAWDGYVGYGLFYLLARFYRAAHAVGLVDVIDLRQMAPPPGGSEGAVQQLAFLTRLLCLMMVCALVLATMRLGRLLSGSQAAGFLAALALSGTHAVTIHTVTTRSELPSQLFALLAVLLLVTAVAAGRTRPSATLAALTGAAFCALFAMYSKVSAVPLALFLIVVPFGALALEPDQRRAMAHSRPMVVMAVIAAVAMAGLAAPPVIAILGRNARVYNGLTLAGIAVAIMMYARLRSLGWKDALAGMAAVLFGLSLAQWLLLIDQHQINTTPVLNYLDTLSLRVNLAAGQHLPDFGTPDKTVLSAGLPLAALFGKLGAGLAAVFSDSVFHGEWAGRKSEIAYVLGMAGALPVLWLGGATDRLRVAMLLVMVVAVEAVLRFHSFNSFYYGYVEPYVFVLAAVVGVRLFHLMPAPLPRRAPALVFAVAALWIWLANDKYYLLADYAAHWHSECRFLMTDTPMLADFVRPYCYPNEDGTWRSAARVPWMGEDFRRSFLGVGHPWLPLSEWQRAAP